MHTQNYSKEYIKYKNRYILLKYLSNKNININMMGGTKNGKSQINTLKYDAIICKEKDYYSEHMCSNILGKISVYENEKFSNILSKINKFLKTTNEKYKKVNDFVYLQEDGG